MTILRNDTQVALNDLHVALEHSAHDYRDAAEFLDDTTVSKQFSMLATERETLAGKLAAAIRETGDLPSLPDTDRETGEQLLHRLSSLFSADQTQEVIAQRREAEQELLALCNSEALSVLDKNYGEIKARCHRNIQKALNTLDRLSTVL